MTHLRLRETLHRYLGGEISLDQLEEWLAERIPIFFQLPELPETRLALVVEHGLAQLSDETLNEDEFRAFIENALAEQSTIIDTYEPSRVISETLQVTQTSSAASNTIIPGVNIVGTWQATPEPAR